jgi:hypothetical protein
VYILFLDAVQRMIVDALDDRLMYEMEFMKIILFVVRLCFHALTGTPRLWLEHRRVFVTMLEVKYRW